MTGHASINGLVDATANASTTFDTVGSYLLDDGDGTANERLYILDGDLTPALTNVDALGYTGKIQFDDLVVTATVPALASILPELSFKADATYDFATDDWTFVWDDEHLTEQIAELIADGLNEFSNTAGTVADILNAVPVVGSDLSTSYATLVDDTFLVSYQPGGARQALEDRVCN